MPRYIINIQDLFPTFSLPSVKNYIIFSAILFFSGFYYYYRILQTLKLEIGQQDSVEQEIDQTDYDTNLLKNLSNIIRKHRLFFYILLNTCCALVALLGKMLNNVFFGTITNQEETILKKYFRRYVQTKLTFIIFISHHNLLEDILIWTPWTAIYVVCLLLLELTALRIASTQNLVFDLVRRKLFAVTSITGISSLLMIFFVIGIKNYINMNYCFFLANDCLILFIQSLHLLCKLTAFHEMSAQTQQQQGGFYYIDLTCGLLRDFLEFANYLHMIFYSQLAITYCCVFLIIQAQHYYNRVSIKIRKHWQQRQIINHINNSYSSATEEELAKTEQCLICWQPMKSAKKLPCSHIFHGHCLRRWLEHDSSCAVCRKSLNLNLNVLRRRQPAGDNVAAGGGGVDDASQAFQIIVELISPHNNRSRLARWWTRFLFDSLDEEQITAMVSQVAEMFPQVPVETIRQLVNNTGSVTATIDALLGGNAQQIQQANGENNNAAQQAQVVQNDTESDESEEGGGTPEEDDTQSSEVEEVAPLVAQQQPSTAAQFPGGDSGAIAVQQKTVQIKTKNDWLNREMEKMLAINRSKYIESSKGVDLRP